MGDPRTALGPTPTGPMQEERPELDPQNRDGSQIVFLTSGGGCIIRHSMRSESDRTRLIAELASLLSECSMPDDARCAGLTLIGWLARRMPGEAASTDGVEHARQQLEDCFRAKMNGLAATASSGGSNGVKDHDGVARAEGPSFEEREEVAPKSGPRKSGPAGSNGKSAHGGGAVVEGASIGSAGSERVPRPS